MCAYVVLARSEAARHAAMIAHAIHVAYHGHAVEVAAAFGKEVPRER